MSRWKKISLAIASLTIMALFEIALELAGLAELKGSSAGRIIFRVGWVAWGYYVAPRL